MVELSRAIYSVRIYLEMFPKLIKEQVKYKTSRIIHTYNFGQILTIAKKEIIHTVFNRKKREKISQSMFLHHTT